MPEKRKRQSSLTRTPLAQKEPRNTPKKDALRTVRPRPLHVEEKVRILWAGRDLQELDDIDGGAFASWLQKADQDKREGRTQAGVGSCQAEVVVIGYNFKPLPAPATYPTDHPTAVSAADVRAHAIHEDGEGIAVPSFREVPASDRPHADAIEDEAEGSSTRGETAYIRYRELTQDERDLIVEYDLDDEDEEWLARRNKKGGGQNVTEDELERLINGFETAKHAALEQRGRWRPGHTSPPASDLSNAAPADLYPVSSALQEYPDVPSLTVRAVHNYWALKSAAALRPLLRRFWYDPPWGAQFSAARKQQEDSESDEDDDGVPFQGKDPPKAHARGRRLDLEDVEDRLFLARDDLERVRTLADQVRRREKTKKRLLQLWQEQWRGKLAAVRARKQVRKRAPAAAKKTKPAAASGAAAKAAKTAPKPPMAVKKVKERILPAVVPTAARARAALPPPVIAPAPLFRGRGLRELVALSSFGMGALLASALQGRRPTRPVSSGEVAPVAIAQPGADAAAQQDPQPRKPAAKAAGQRKQDARKTANPATEPAVLSKPAIQKQAARRNPPSKQVRFAGADAGKRTTRQARAGAAEPSEQDVSEAGRKGPLPAQGHVQKDASRRPRSAALREDRARDGAAAANRAMPADAPSVADQSDDAALPPGITRRVRFSGAKPNGWTDYLLECKHETMRVDRIPKAAEFFNKHAGCRPEWKRLARQLKESAAQHEVRLREILPFKVPPRTASPAAGSKVKSAKAASSLPKAARTARAAKTAEAKPPRSGWARAAPRARGDAGRAEEPALGALRKLAAAREVEPAKRAPWRRNSRHAPEEIATAAALAAEPQPASGLPQRSDVQEEGSQPAFAASSASGSDTVWDTDSSGDAAVESAPVKRRRFMVPAARITRQSSVHVEQHVRLPNVPLEWQSKAACDAPSDVSSFSEGSGPSLFEVITAPVRRQSHATQHRRPVAGKDRNGVTDRQRQKLVLAAIKRRRTAH